MTATDIDAIRQAIRADHSDDLAWQAYADALTDSDDPRGELVALMIRQPTDREGRKRLAHLRGTLPLLSADAMARVELIGREWAAQAGAAASDVPNLLEELLGVLLHQCHPALRRWWGGYDLPGRQAARLIVLFDGRRWVYHRNDGQGGGGAYPTRAEALLAAVAEMSIEQRSQLRWIEIR